MIKSSMITNKGKKAVSYRFINGDRVPCWIIENGGVTCILEKTKELLINGNDVHDIRAVFNISASTLINFIKKHDIKLAERELINRKIRGAERKSTALTGISKSTKGKTYKEIYGTNLPKCGFKTGHDNPNFYRDKFTGCNKINKYGEKFRSNYEVCFSEILRDNNILYDYEHHFKLCNGKVKIVDFIVNGDLVEITGYAYTAWKDDFDIKIQLLKLSYPEKNIIIISTENNISELKSKHSNIATILPLNSVDIIEHLKNKLPD